MIDIDKLDRLHAEASPGRWRGDRYDGTVKYSLLGGTELSPLCVVQGNDGEGHETYGFHRGEDERCVMALHNAWPAISRELRALRRLLSAADALRPPLDQSRIGTKLDVDVRAIAEFDEAIAAAKAAREEA